MILARTQRVEVNALHLSTHVSVLSTILRFRFPGFPGGKLGGGNTVTTLDVLNTLKGRAVLVSQALQIYS